MSSPTSKFARVSALIGALLWLITLLIRTGDSPETDLIEKIFLFAAFVIVPLALSIILTRENWIALRIVTWLLPPSALLCFVSFVTPQGLVAGCLASVWLVTTTLVALAGVQRLLLMNQQPRIELSISAGMIYLPVGGAWLVASRLGIQPLGFGDTIVLLTAMHFHFAGFAAPVLAGLAGRFLTTRVATRFAGAAALAIILGTPVVAVGIPLSPTLALIGALIMTIGLTLLAITVIVWIVPAVGSLLVQVLLVISSASSFAAMILASLYAYSIVQRTVILDIPRMALSHGLLNSLGFAGCGLVAWAVLAGRNASLRDRALP